MSVHRQPENTNKSHEAHPSLGKATIKGGIMNLMNLKQQLGWDEFNAYGYQSQLGKYINEYKKAAN